MKTLFSLVLMLSAINSYADTTSSQQDQQANSSSSSGSNNAGNAQSLTYNQAASIIPDSTSAHVTYSGSQTVRNVPSVSGQSLTTSNDTCMGSSSGSANGPGFGVSIGSTWSDANCKLLKNSRELWNMGMRAAALALMCKDSDNREALEITGYLCPVTQSVKKAAKESQGSPDMSDPYIAARLAN
jgi:hypothetical protein